MLSLRHEYQQDPTRPVGVAAPTGVGTAAAGLAAKRHRRRSRGEHRSGQHVAQARPRGRRRRAEDPAPVGEAPQADRGAPGADSRVAGPWRGGAGLPRGCVDRHAHRQRAVPPIWGALPPRSRQSAVAAGEVEPATAGRAGNTAQRGSPQDLASGALARDQKKRATKGTRSSG